MAGVGTAATAGTSALAQIPGNGTPIIIREIPLIRTPRLLNFQTLSYGTY